MNVVKRLNIHKKFALTFFLYLGGEQTPLSEGNHAVSIRFISNGYAGVGSAKGII